MTLAAFVLISILGGDVRDSLPAPGPPRMEPFIRDDADVSGLVGSAETQTDDSEVLDHLAWLREHPYDLNRVTRDELCSLPGVTDLEADAVVEFRESIRKFTSVGQLAELNGIGGQILAKL